MSNQAPTRPATPPIVFEDVTCMLCGSAEKVPAGETAWRGNRLTYSLCGDCGLKYMDPRPTREWYIDFYANEFWEDKFQNRTWQEAAKANWLWKLLKGGVSGRVRKGTKRARMVVPEILKRARLDAQSKVLDVGCAFGLILHEIKARTGAQVHGIEPNKSARAEAERRTGVKFIGTSAEDLITLKGYEGAFDLISFSNVLENIVDPRQILKACRELLSDKGVLYIDTPNVYYYDAMNPYHPFIYSPETLRALLESCGLKVVDLVFEQPTSSAADIKKPFAMTRPRFATAYAVKGEMKPVERHKPDTAAMLSDIAVSARRYESLKGSA